jgi:hypothetical protein
MANTVDIDLLIKELRHYGHSVEDAHPVPENAGDYLFTVDGGTLTLAQARDLLAGDEAKAE